MNILQHLTHTDSHFLVHNFVKIYPHKVRLFDYKTPYQKRHENLEPMQTLSSIGHLTPTRKNDSDPLERSIRRTQTIISDIVLSNNFDLFGTLTLDPQKVDRYNHAVSKKALSNWLNNQRKSTGAFKYLIVPELHKDGAIHFHGLFANYTGSMLKTAHKDPKGRSVYNLTSYPLGFTNFTQIGDLNKTANYVKKYITKDMTLDANKRRYWHSLDCKTPAIEYNVDKQRFINSCDAKPVYEHDLFTAYDIPLTTDTNLLLKQNVI